MVGWRDRSLAQSVLDLGLRIASHRRDLLDGELGVVTQGPDTLSLGLGKMLDALSGRAVHARQRRRGLPGWGG